MSVAQYRSPDVVLVNQETAIPLADTKGALVVSVAPPSPAAFGGAVYKTAGGTGFAAVQTVTPAGSRVLELLYVGLPAAIGAGPYYVVIVDQVAALAGGERSVIPTPKMTSAGELFFWEPPGGFLFTLGIQIAISTTPVIYTASAQTCSVTCETRDP